MNHRPSVPASNSRIINGTALGFSILFLLASLAAACFVGEWGHVFLDWRRIMISPCPLVTDYLAIGGLSSAFLNAGACGLACFFFMVLLKGDSHANTLAGYFLVVAHCFYGLNFLNMWPCFLAPFLYMKRKGLDFKENLHICMFATSFAPFISEFLFRYTLGDDFVYGQVRLTVSGVNGVERFDEDSIALSTENGRLLVQGEDLHIEKLSLDGGDLLVEGTVDSLTYEEEEPPRGGLLGRLFRG